MGYTFFELTFLKLLLISIIPALLSIFLPKNLISISDLLSYILYFQVIVPSLTIPFYVLNDIDFSQWFPYWFGIVSCYILMTYLSKFKTLKIDFEINDKLGNLVIFSIIAMSFLVLILSYKPDINLLMSTTTIDELYSLRMDYRDQNENVNIFARYFFSWDAKVLIPLLVILGIFYKNKVLIFIGVISQLLIFSINGQKSVVLGVLLAIGIYFLSKKDKSGYKLFYIISCSIILFVLLDLLLGIGVFSNIIVRRMFVVPGVLTSYYLDFYSSGIFHEYSDSFFSGIIEPQYSQTAARVIGLIYFNREELAANVNFFSAAYSNFGIVSVYIESIILCLMLYVIHSIGKKKDRAVYLSLFVTPIIALSDSALFTTILTNGIALATLVLFLLSKKNE